MTIIILGSSGFVGKACESKEPIPLACGAPCQTKCMQLPVANDSVEHCEQIKPDLYHH